jgi:transketolase
MTPFDQKFTAFGWHVQTINGNVMSEVVAALDAAVEITDRPTAIVAQTQKGFGILPILEESGDLNFHGQALSPEVAEKALAHLA